MATILLAWNPKRWKWGDFSRELATVRRSGEAVNRWSCGSSRRIRPGDRFFLIRLGDSKRGIVGSGRIESEPHLGTHWDQDRAARGDQARYVDIRFDALYVHPRVPWIELKAPPFDQFNWGIQMSGVQVPAALARELEARWSQVNPLTREVIPEEIDASSFPEGAAKKIIVNAYERDPQARRVCIAYYGAVCFVCGFNFEEHYGPIGEGYIHIHHLIPLSQVLSGYRVDPIEDLRPLCANCHAVAHLRRTPFTPTELKKMMKRRTA